MQKKQQDQSQLKWIADFIWNIADDRLRDVYVRGKYRDVILPFTVLRWLDAVLESTKQKVLERKRFLDKNYSSMSDSAEVAAVESAAATSVVEAGQPKIDEHALYPLLSQYLWEEFDLYSKRIDEKRSSNKRGPNGNRWLYPDVVGMEDLGADWHQEVRDCVNQYSDKRTKLWSFEVKLLINRSNVREYFFQTVSNSSWANFGYLVAAEVGGQDTLKELQMLFAAHGIGFIKLDVDNPADSQVLIPARERDEIDWDMANRLATENRDFLEYVKLVKQFYQTGEARAADWDVSEATE